jgi:hypothetical protein
LGRFGAKGLVVVLSVVGVVALRKYVPERAVAPICLILLVVLSSGIVIAHESNYQRYQFEQSQATVSWETTYIGPSERFTDWQTQSNLEYYYASKGIANYWDKYQFNSYSPENYQTLIDGGGFRGDYWIVDLDLEKPIRPQEYGHLEPLAPYYEEIVYQNRISKTYSNGEHAILKPAAPGVNSS